jgi:hypothetical protein
MAAAKAAIQAGNVQAGAFFDSYRAFRCNLFVTLA